MLIFIIFIIIIVYNLSAKMWIYNIISNISVMLLIAFIFQNQDEVKPTHNGFCQVDIVLKTHGWYIPTPDWVRGCNNAAPGLQLGHDACLGDGNGLLLHGLVDASPVDFVHFVEFINAADTVISKYKWSTF